MRLGVLINFVLVKKNQVYIFCYIYEVSELVQLLSMVFVSISGLLFAIFDKCKTQTRVRLDMQIMAFQAKARAD